MKTFINLSRKPKTLNFYLGYCFNDKWDRLFQTVCHKCHNTFTLTKQTCSALVTTLRCTACLIEDLLSRNYEFVLTSRIQTDPLELRFSKYWQMSGGRFLIGLRDIELSERVLLTTSLLKDYVDIFHEDLRNENMDKNLLILFD